MSVLFDSIYKLITLVALIFPIAALASESQVVNFSPYADLTINAHWDSHYQDMEPMDLIAISQSTSIRSYHLAFITDAGSCHPAWGGQANYSIEDKWAAHLTDNMRASSINYIISFGGASGSDISQSCSEQQLISIFEKTLNIYQPQGLDFDIENGSANVVKLISALKQVQNTHPNLKISFTLPVLPEGLTNSGQEIVKQAKENNLEYSVNIMAMDYGPAYTNDMGQYAIDAASNVFSFLKNLYSTKSVAALWQMIEVTPMIGVNDVNTEQFTLTNVNTLRNFAEKNKLRSLSMWSIARDNPCADKYASPTCSGNNLQSSSYEFSRRFVR